MLVVFQRGRRDRQPADPRHPDLPEDAVWLDLLDPSAEEIAFVQRAVGIEMPTREEMREIEASARVYEEGNALYLTATVLVDADDPPPATSELTFILKGDRLVTLRYADPQPFRTLDARLERQGATLTSAQAVFFWLVDAIVARTADVLERTAQDVNALSGEIFGAARLKREGGRPDLVDAIARIGRGGDTASTTRESLHTLHRIMLAASTLERLPADGKEARRRAKTIERDIRSLADQAAFLTHKIGFLLDATLGLIDIEQTKIIKIFSVLAIVFLPPTLIASIYGMNFAYMPELGWRLGYPLSILLMVASALLPFWFFRRRGWL